MGKTFKHQDTYDYLNDNKKLPHNRLIKVLRLFRRCNFWDWDLRILYRKHKDYVRGGTARIKGKNYKNR